MLITSKGTQGKTTPAPAPPNPAGLPALGARVWDPRFLPDKHSTKHHLKICSASQHPHSRAQTRPFIPRHRPRGCRRGCGSRGPAVRYRPPIPAASRLLGDTATVLLLSAAPRPQRAATRHPAGAGVPGREGGEPAGRAGVPQSPRSTSQPGKQSKRMGKIPAKWGSSRSLDITAFGFLGTETNKC